MFTLILGVLFVIGCDVASSYFLASGKLTLSESVVYSATIVLIGSIIAFLCGSLFLLYPNELIEKASPSALYIALFSTPFVLLANMYIQMFSAMQNFKLYAILNIIQVIFLFLLTVILVYIYSMGVNGALIAILMTSVFMILMCLMIFNFKYSLRFVKIKKKKLLAMYGYGLRYYAGKLGNTANAQLGVLVLAFLMSAESVGIFTVAFQLITRVMLIPDTLFVLLSPKCAASKDGAPDLVTNFARYNCALCTIVLFLFFFLCGPFINSIYPPEFFDAVLLIKIMTIGVLMRCSTKILVPYFLGTNLPGVASLSVVLGLIVNIIGYFIFVPILGLSGAAISVILSYFTSSLLLFIYFSSYTKSSFRKCFIINISDITSLKDTWKKSNNA